MKQELFRICAVVVGLVLVTIFVVRSGFWQSGTAYAVGDLLIDWGAPAGDPIFVVVGMMPGQIEERDVEITNNAPMSRPIGVRGSKTVELGSIGDVLDVVISRNGTVLYGEGSGTGPRTLSEFFADSTSMDGIPLLTLASSEHVILTFVVTFREDAGNDFQDASVTFDITLGIAISIPAGCRDIEFDTDPIFGTAGGDRLVGTHGNDLIFGLEGGDSMRGGNGDDCLVGNEAGDSLKGENGKDVLVGGEHGDSLRGGNGIDQLFGGEGSDSLHGENGNDSLAGEGGNDLLKGGRGDDELFGGEGQDSADGEQGRDTCEVEVEQRCEA